MALFDGVENKASARTPGSFNLGHVGVATITISEGITSSEIQTSLFNWDATRYYDVPGSAELPSFSGAVFKIDFEPYIFLLHLSRVCLLSSTSILNLVSFLSQINPCTRCIFVMDVPDSNNLRLHTICSTTPPKEASLSDFGYAAAPALGLYLEQCKDLSADEKRRARREFLKLIWSCWSEVWEGNVEYGDRKLTTIQKSLLTDIVSHITSEYDIHCYYVQIGRKTDALIGNNNPWNEIMRAAIHESHFARWADPEYVLSICLPAPPATPVNNSQYANLPWEEAWQAMIQEYMVDWGTRASNETFEEQERKRTGEIPRGDWEFMFQ
ncbi:hypothetical protein AAF712_012210 [Marasmius tenuissimus]|uniref:Uncharacterized protein n=1 Tax=Marasmius tenuissimus TaxID=585030 RepID=A0ABR2ZIE7_9AGAR